jgi:hypothetical protein
MYGRYPELGCILKDLSRRSGLSQPEIMDQLPEKHDPRDLRRWQAGETRPGRTLLIHLLVQTFKIESIQMINDALDAADYLDLSSDEIREFSLNNPRTLMPLLPYEPVQVRWGPTDGQRAGIICRSIADPQREVFIPWDELKTEVEERLLNQCTMHVPAGSKVVLEDYNGQKDWLGRIRGNKGNHIGDLWFGTNPDDLWRFDGLVRVGKEISDGQCTVWQVFQRYSDGSYARLRIQKISGDLGRT